MSTTGGPRGGSNERLHGAIAWLVVGLMVLVPVTVRSPLPVTMASVVFLAVSVLGIIGLGLSARRAVGPVARAALVAAAVVVPSVLSLVANLDRPGLLSYVPGGLAPFVGLAVAAWYLLVRRSRAAPDFASLSRAMVWASIPLALLAIAQDLLAAWPVLDQISPGEFRSSAYDHRAGSIFGHPIVYGAFAGVAGLLALALRPPLWGVALGLNIVGMALSGSRSAWIAFAVAALAYALLALWRRVPRVSFAEAARVVIVPIVVLGTLTLVTDGRLDAGDGGDGGSASPTPDAEDRLLEIGDAYSGRYRLQQWTGGLVRIASSPEAILFGHGPGSSLLLFSREQLGPLPGPATFDNAYMTIWYEQGTLGLVALVGVAGVAFATAGTTGRLVLLLIGINLLFYDGYRWPVIQAVAVVSTLIERSRHGDAGGAAATEPRAGSA